MCLEEESVAPKREATITLAMRGVANNSATWRLAYNWVAIERESIENRGIHSYKNKNKIKNKNRNKYQSIALSKKYI